MWCGHRFRNRSKYSRILWTSNYCHARVSSIPEVCFAEEHLQINDFKWHTSKVEKSHIYPKMLGKNEFAKRDYTTRNMKMLFLIFAKVPLGFKIPIMLIRESLCKKMLSRMAVTWENLIKLPISDTDKEYNAYFPRSRFFRRKKPSL